MDEDSILGSEEEHEKKANKAKEWWGKGEAICKAHFASENVQNLPE
jgi:hypothetical protein